MILYAEVTKKENVLPNCYRTADELYIFFKRSYELYIHSSEGVTTLFSEQDYAYGYFDSESFPLERSTIASGFYTLGLNSEVANTLSAPASLSSAPANLTCNYL